jgi:hypothetical protein
LQRDVAQLREELAQSRGGETAPRDDRRNVLQRPDAS